MTLLYDDPIFLEHETGTHPENANRLRSVRARLSDREIDQQCVKPNWKPAIRDQLLPVHSSDNIDAIEAFVNAGGGPIEQDTIVSPRSFDVALSAAGAACDATRRVLGGESSSAFCLIRPPGHHALHSRPMGFCLFNNVAVAARFAVDQLGLDRVLIVDWDVHHGNGTQDIFWEDPHIAFLSMHRFPFYPGSGSADERGQGAGAGLTVNLPITFGTSPKEQIKQFRSAVESLAEKHRPQLVLISAGFDSHVDDPIGSLQLESDDFTTLTEVVLDVAQVHCGGRVVSLLEGGYNPLALAESVECHLLALLQSDRRR